jgi:hypothetical protein
MALLGGLARLATCLLLAWNLPVPAAPASVPASLTVSGSSTTDQRASIVLPDLVRPPPAKPERLKRGPAGQKAALPCGCARAAISIAAAGSKRNDGRPISPKRLSFEARGPPAAA